MMLKSFDIRCIGIPGSLKRKTKNKRQEDGRAEMTEDFDQNKTEIHNKTVKQSLMSDFLRHFVI